MEIFHWRMPAAMHLRAFLFPLSLSLYIFHREILPSAHLVSYFLPRANRFLTWSLLISQPFAFTPSFLPRLFLSFALLKSLLVTLSSPTLRDIVITLSSGEDRSIRERVLYSGDFVGWKKKKKRKSADNWIINYLL